MRSPDIRVFKPCISKVLQPWLLTSLSKGGDSETSYQQKVMIGEYSGRIQMSHVTERVSYREIIRLIRRSSADVIHDANLTQYLHFQASCSVSIRWLFYSALGLLPFYRPVKEYFLIYIIININDHAPIIRLL